MGANDTDVGVKALLSELDTGNCMAIAARHEIPGKLS